MYKDNKLFTRIATALGLRQAWEPSETTLSQIPESNPENEVMTESSPFKRIKYTDPEFNIDWAALYKLRDYLEEERIKHEKMLDQIEQDPENKRYQKALYDARVKQASEIKTIDMFKQICPTLKGRVLGILERYPTIADLMKARIETGREAEGAGIDTWYRIMSALNALDFPMESAGNIGKLYAKYLELKGKREIPRTLYFDVEKVQAYNPNKVISTDNGIITSGQADGYYVLLENGNKIVVRREDVKRIHSHQ